MIQISTNLFCIILLFTRCSDSVLKKDSKTTEKLLNKAVDFNITINNTNAFEKNSDVFVPVVLSNLKYELLAGFIDCNITDTTRIDTTYFSLIKGCTQLIISNDTANIWFTTGDKSGKYQFGKVTLLGKGNDNKYYYQDYLFEYIIK